MRTRPARILWVEDNRSLAGVYQDLVESKFHCEVLAAHTSEEAVELIEKHCFDLIFLDIVVPKVGGIGVAEYVTQRNLDVPVVVLSCNITADSVAAFNQLGILMFVSKTSGMEAIYRLLPLLGIRPSVTNPPFESPRTLELLRA